MNHVFWDGCYTELSSCPTADILTIQFLKYFCFQTFLVPTSELKQDTTEILKSQSLSYWLGVCLHFKINIWDCMKGLNTARIKAAGALSANH